MLTTIVGSEDPRSVLPVLFAYLFRKINKYEYREQLPSREYAKELWERVSGAGYVLVNCKLYLWARVQAKANGRRLKHSAFEISDQDAKLLNSIDLSHISLDYPAFSLKTYMEEEGRILTHPDEGLQVYIGKFISKKMIFLCRHYGVKRNHIEGVLLDAALYALRKQYPFYESKLHMVNVCKTAIHNAGITLIQFWTREKRNALIKESDGTFSAVHVDLEVAQYMQTLGTVDPHDNPEVHDLQALRATQAKMGPKARMFFDLASGKHHSGFSMFLGTDNSDLAHDWGYERYLASICTYMKVSMDQAQKFMQFLKRNV
jgi:hypothetical protein